MPREIGSNQARLFKRYFSHINADTLGFRETVLPLLNNDWSKSSELLINKMQSFAGRMDDDIYYECVTATKNYINSRDFDVPEKYETTSYLFGAFQYVSESSALTELNKQLDKIIRSIQQESESAYWTESCSSILLKTASTFLSVFDYAKSNPLSTIMTLLYGQVVFAAAFPSVINLPDLDGTNGFKVNGETSGDRNGYSVSNAGDINGDGYDDFIIGAPWLDSGSKALTGMGYVVFGKAQGFTSSFDLTSLNGINGFKIIAEAACNCVGWSVSFAGDVNGDGYDDVIIGAQAANELAGAGYVLFGHANIWPSSLELSSLNGTNGFKLNGEQVEDRAGWTVSSAGDINNDGYDDLVICAREASPNGLPCAGSCYVVFGKADVWVSPFELASLNGTNGFKLNGEWSYGIFGNSASSAGDINGDGYDDLIIGEPEAAPNNKEDGGSSHVIFGKANGWPSVLALASLNGTNGFKINGDKKPGEYGEGSGWSVSSAGDVNGDGYDDMIIGAPRATYNGIDFFGASYVVFGKANGWTSNLELLSLNGTNGFKINGGSGGSCGCSVSSAGDINSDGYSDLIIGADSRYNYRGGGYVVFGKSSGWNSYIDLSNLNGINGFKICGAREYGYSGYSVSNAGDINGDGYGDIIIGEPGEQSTNIYGASYVIFGNKVLPVLTCSSGFTTYKVNDLATIIDAGITLDSLPTTIVYATVSIASNFNSNQDLLNFVNQSEISGFYNNATGVLNLTGISSVINYQNVLRNVTYYNLAGSPNLLPRKISFIAYDGVEFSLPAIRTIVIIGNSLSTEQVIGIVVGIGAVLIAAAGGVFCYRKHCHHAEASPANKKIKIIGSNNKPISPMLSTINNIEMGELVDGDNQHIFNAQSTRVIMQPSAPVFESHNNNFVSNNSSFFQADKVNEQKETAPKFNWQQTDFDAELIKQAKDIVLEPRYMCPVLERPMYDAVYIKAQGDDKLLAISDEVARAWLVKKKQTTCPIRKLPVEAVFIATDLRGIVNDAIKAQLNQSAQPPAYSSVI